MQTDINLVYTAAEAAQLWSLEKSTVRAACNNGRFTPQEARKSGGTWIITEAAMTRVYGPIEVKPSQ